jgi:hypothetical protein
MKSTTLVEGQIQASVICDPLDLLNFLKLDFAPYHTLNMRLDLLWCHGAFIPLWLQSVHIAFITMGCLPPAFGSLRTNPVSELTVFPGG